MPLRPHPREHQAPALPSLARTIRRTVIDESKRAHIGHIGSSLSIADILAVLYGDVLRIDALDDEARDRFVLSKGHAALALYAALNATGRLSDDELRTFCTDGTAVGGHPEHTLPGVDFSTGSLGQGLSLGAGAALAARMRGEDRRVFVLVSDAECNEGAVWEAVMFAAHHRLANLVAIVDDNRQQAFGYTRDVLDLSPLAARWAAFGWDAHEVDGHDLDALGALLHGLPADDGPPHVVVANTVFGRGVSYMERRIDWHYLPMSDAQYAQAVAELEEAA